MVGLPFFKKKETGMMLGKGTIPVDRVREMASRGFSEPEMIDVLRKDGYSAEEIDHALTQALSMSVTAGARTSMASPQREEQRLPRLEDILAQPPVAPETSLPAEYYNPYSTEEYVDYVVQTRMGDMDEKVNEFSIRYEELEKRIIQINEQLTDLVKSRFGDQQTIVNKVDSFKENIEDLNVRFAGLERAFKDTLPPLIESVRALSDLVQRFKREA